jgi:hypothetical protein
MFGGKFSIPTAAADPRDPDAVLVFGRDRFVGDAEHPANAYLMRLARSPAGALSARYFRGRDRDGAPEWTDDEAGARTVFDAPEPRSIVDQTSVAFAPHLGPHGRWVMLYGGRLPSLALDPNFRAALPALDPREIARDDAGIYLRTADQPWGPWSAPSTIYSPFRAGGADGYCGLLHFDPALGGPANHAFTCVEPPGLADPAVGGWGAEYGASLVPSLFAADGAPGEHGETLTWLMSTWNPYRVVLMRTKVR